MLENEFKKKVAKELRKRDAFVYSVVDRVTAGIPDFILCVNSRFKGLELKCKDRPVTAAQQFWASQIIKSKGDYIVLRHVSDSLITAGDYRESFTRGFSSITDAVDWILV